MMKIFLFLLMMTFGGFAHAQNSTLDLEHEESRSGRPLELNTSTFQTGLAVYLGLNVGYSSENSAASDREMPASIKLLGSYLFAKVPLVADLGYGIQRSSFTDKTPPVAESTRGIFETALRYQIGRRWQAGAVYNQIANQGDRFEANQADVQFVGLQALNEFGIAQTFLGRFGVRAMTSLNIKGESVNMVLFDFQMGWGRTNLE